MMDSQIPSAWNRIVLGTERVTPSVSRTGDIVLPPIFRAADLPIELSGLMPNRDHNGDLLLALEHMPRCRSGERPVIGILAADPFLRIDQFADRLAEKGYRDVANLPSVTQYGGSFRAVLNDLNVGPAREVTVLAAFARLGFAVSVAIAHNDDIAPALALSPAHLFVVPSFDLWAGRRARSRWTARVLRPGGRASPEGRPRNADRPVREPHGDIHRRGPRRRRRRRSSRLTPRPAAGLV